MKRFIKVLLFSLVFLITSVKAEEWTCKYQFKDYNHDNYVYYLEFRYNTNSGVVGNKYDVYRSDGKNKYSGSGTGSLNIIGGNGGLIINSNLTVSNINKMSSAYQSGCPDNNGFTAFLSAADGESWYSSPASQNTQIIPNAYTMIRIDSSGNGSVTKRDFHSNEPVTGTECKGNKSGNCPKGQECVHEGGHYYCKMISDYIEECPKVTYKPDKTEHDVLINSVDIIYRQQRDDKKFHPQIVSVDPPTTFDTGSVRYQDKGTYWLATFLKRNVSSGQEGQKTIKLPYYTKCSDINPADFKTYDTTGSSDPGQTIYDYTAKDPTQEFAGNTSNCKQILGPSLTAVVKAGIRAIQIIGAIIAIVKGMMLLLPAIIAKDADGLKKASKTLVSMAIILVVIFLLPGLLRFLGKIAGFDVSCLV